jgi:hypothetical protein
MTKSRSESDIFLPKTDLRKWLGIEPKRRPPLNWYVAKRPDKGILKTSRHDAADKAAADKAAAHKAAADKAAKPSSMADLFRPPPGFRVTKGSPLKNPQHPVTRIAALRAEKREADSLRKAMDSMTRKILESRRLKAAGLI